MDLILSINIFSSLMLEKDELIIIGSVICLLLILIVYFTFFRTRSHNKLDLIVEEQYLAKRKLQPTKEEILNALLEFDDYPAFVKIITEVLNNFTLDYLYSYGEIPMAFAQLVDFPKQSKGISARQKGAMAKIVRIFSTSEFILGKCGRVIDEELDNFLDETNL